MVREGIVGRECCKNRIGCGPYRNVKTELQEPVFTFGGSTLLVPTRLLHLELGDSQLGRSEIVFEINVGGAGNHIDDRPFFETVAVFLFGM